MAQTNQKRRQRKSSEHTNHDDEDILYVRKGATLKEIYAAAQKAFTAADLQKYTVIEKGIPLRKVLAESEARDREAAKKRRRKAQHVRQR